MSQRRYIVSQNLIAANIERISAFSWEGYQKAGRGVVLIDAEEADEKRLRVGPLVYLSDPEAQEERGGWPTPDIAEIVNIYDPEREVIVILRWRNGIGAYRFKPPIAPPAAYRSLMKSDQEQ
ncbi:MAG: hypothetical protein Kow0063_41690 [Anaerolineae bacterium]